MFIVRDWYRVAEWFGVAVSLLMLCPVRAVSIALSFNKILPQQSPLFLCDPAIFKTRSLKNVDRLYQAHV